MADSLFERDGSKGEGVGGIYVRVAIERGIDVGGGHWVGDSEEGLTYRADWPDVAVGEAVEAPLGRRDKPATGIVVRVGGEELLAGLDPSRVKHILRRTGTGLTEPLVELGRWMSWYYVCPLGMVLRTMVPSAVKRAVGRRRRVELVRVGEVESAEDSEPIRLPPATAEAWEAIGTLPDDELKLTARELAGRIGLGNVGPINRLIRLGLLREVERSEVRASVPAWEGWTVEADPLTKPPALSITQQAIVDGVEPGVFGVHLIGGVTGSGKTEVYLRLIERVLQRGQSAIVLVPEIALTPQTAGRFLVRFAERGGVAVLHSGLSAAQRHRQWEMVRTGQARVVVGARSAVFAPVENLGLIVVDEEHDDSGYKQDQLPRYHGRDVAIKRGQIEHCPVVLGSATPSLESWHNATRGRYTLWELTERLAGGGGGALPRVRVVDLMAERRARIIEDQDHARQLHLLGPTLEGAIEDVLGKGGQALLLLNRRGWANYVCCPDARCGWVLVCDNCDATMVLHKAGGGLPAGGVVRCHHCQAEKLLPRSCPTCGKRVNTFGLGTQRVEDELERKFGDSLGLVRGETMLRVDGDTMRSARDYFSALSRFASGRIKLLLGTQMIAKGLDYPNVRLVGIISADTAINLPDFRASERTFQLVCQVAGRAGRGNEPGLVIVQTLRPDEPAIALASKHDYRAFAERELAFRRASALPPITRMARIVVRDPSQGAAIGGARELGRLLREATADLDGPVRIDGPMLCPISRVAGQYRAAIEITASTASLLLKPLALLRRRGLLKSDAKTAVDVDPTALM